MCLEPAGREDRTSGRGFDPPWSTLHSATKRMSWQGVVCASVAPYVFGVEQRGSVTALTIWTQGDGLLSVLAPIGLAAAAGTSLVIDLDPDGPSFGGSVSLAALVRSGPRRDDLRPQASGPAVLANGGIDPGEAETVVRALIEGWPSIVMRSPCDAGLFAPVVPVYPLLPGSLTPSPDRFCVFQRTGFYAERGAEGIEIPRPSAATVRSLLTGSLPGRSRWVRAWRPVWEHPWR